MTAIQYYFPYFFDENAFNKTIKSFGLTSHILYDKKTQIPETLLIKKLYLFNFVIPEDRLLTIPFGTALMVQDGKIFFWKTNNDILDITQGQLSKLKDDSATENIKIDLSLLLLGHNKIDFNLDLTNFVTFARKSDLKYDEEYYEKFVIVLINRDDIELIPFDQFNKTGGDYGYVWPATARLDVLTSKIYGQGMRMGNFAIELNKLR